ncbi:Senescence/spartin-associated [Penicillium cf. griseofulvum]|uniref:Senescence/spartin-associated n=1 Tax=Penicillium cf. griseofulvum TaxID=2972120 RepID=A0A9W9IUJ4_9EURO|nr:Senescence/spartin-associated [Penicillium cf. griseofulvum]KAJ5430615.1 Senescence/spartin-associated [Penicillium cf. griseofulvum]
MASAAHDPRLLYSVNNIRAFHIQNGEEQELTPSGPQTLSLLMVPTNTATAGPGTDYPEDSPEEDFYLHLYLPPELDIAIPATTQIFHQPPDSYLIPRWDMGPDAGAFIRIQFPSIGAGPSNVSQDDIDTFESILAQCTAFLERTPHPKAGDHTAYNPADYAPGEGYVGTPDTKKADTHGRIVLVDEENGSVVGELGDGYNVVEDADVKPGSKRPVGIELPAEGGGNQVSVSNVSEEYLAMARHPAYKNSTLVQSSATASRLIVTGSTYLASAIASGAENFQKRTQPNVKPLKFSDATHARIRKVGTFSNGAADISARTVGQVGKVAQNLGASLARKQESGRKGIDKRNPPPEYKPGVLNKSMIAFSTLADGIEQSARNMLFSGATAASSMIDHRYGSEAGSVATNLTGGIKNVGLVYIDATGVSRRALLKSVAKGMVVGKMRDGQQVVVGGGDGGHVSPSAAQAASRSSGLGARDPVVRRASPNPTPPPAYGASGTMSLDGTPKSGGKR